MNRGSAVNKSVKAIQDISRGSQYYLARLNNLQITDQEQNLLFLQLYRDISITHKRFLPTHMRNIC